MYCSDGARLRSSGPTGRTAVALRPENAARYQSGNRPAVRLGGVETDQRRAVEIRSDQLNEDPHSINPGKMAAKFLSPEPW